MLIPQNLNFSNDCMISVVKLFNFRVMYIVLVVEWVYILKYHHVRTHLQAKITIPK